MRWILPSFLGCLALTAPASAQNVDDMMRRAMNNLSHEYVECSAYFQVVAVAAENSGDNELRDKYNQVGDAALANAIMVGESANLLLEVHEARLSMAIKDMAGRINNDTANISILMSQYSDLCVQAMEQIGARMDYWVDLEIKRQAP